MIERCGSVLNNDILIEVIKNYIFIMAIFYTNYRINGIHKIKSDSLFRIALISMVIAVIDANISKSFIAIVLLIMSMSIIYSFEGKVKMRF